MARSVLLDYLQVYPFWLMDVTTIGLGDSPLFAPFTGFSSIVAPELSVEITDINEANSLTVKKVVKKGRIAPITLQRGCQFWDSDFYNWIVHALRGKAVHSVRALGGTHGISPRRNFMLVQFFSRTPFSLEVNAALSAIGLTALAASQSFQKSAMSAAQFTATVVTGGALAGTGAMYASSTIDRDIFAMRIPAKAWVLYGCLPTRYKAAGDFDARAGDVSIQEVEFELEAFEEYALGTMGS